MKMKFPFYNFLQKKRKKRRKNDVSIFLFLMAKLLKADKIFYLRDNNILCLIIFCSFILINLANWFNFKLMFLVGSSG